MNSVYKIVLGIVIAIIVTFIGTHLYNQHFRQQEYIKALEQEKDKYINSFYKSSFTGVITYIKEYEKNPNKYVIGIIDSVKNEKTIGKVEITNFSNVMKGDIVKKKINSFELEISGQNGKILSIIKYE